MGFVDPAGINDAAARPHCFNGFFRCLEKTRNEMRELTLAVVERSL